ncbi:MAG TPA: NAD(+) synthase [Candidatus Hydrogenedentes bacterium]|jgi:NAD+ synthase (glutamine-hydrolysing)|nr:NAD(+) synthase [Candidatus Hydrogenedentota bacterium]
MKLIKTGLVSLSVRTGDFSGNTALLMDAIEEAGKAGVQLLIAPELAVSGYNLQSLGMWRDTARQSWASLAEIAAACDGMTAIVGVPVLYHGSLRSGAAVISDKIISGIVLRETAAAFPSLSRIDSLLNGVSAGQLSFDMPWGTLLPSFDTDTLVSPPSFLNGDGCATVICCMAAVPFASGYAERRRIRMLDTARRLHGLCVHTNLLGTDDGRLIFDGTGLIAAPSGILEETRAFSAKQWTLNTVIVDLGELERTPPLLPVSLELEGAEGCCIGISCAQAAFKPASVRAYAKQIAAQAERAGRKSETNNSNQDLDAILHAIALGIRDYYRKAGVFRKILLALSGGQDSALCLLAAVQAARMLAKDSGTDDYASFIQTLYLPNRALSSTAGHDAARALAEELHIPFRVVAIHEEVDIAFSKAVEIMESKKKVRPITRQNLQARIRGDIMLNWANNVDGLVLVTTNMSEVAVGYSTAGGDNQGAYSPLANMPKTLVSRLLAYLEERDGLQSLKKVLALKPSAELAPDQTDEDELMPYPVLDEIIHLHIGKRLSLSLCWRMLAEKFPDHGPETLREWIARFGKRFAASQWKRNQHPVAPKVLDYDLDAKSGIALPVLHRMQSELDDLKNATL